MIRFLPERCAAGGRQEELLVDCPAAARPQLITRNLVAAVETSKVDSKLPAIQSLLQEIWS